jgi:excinuclease ABC subunit B
VNGEVVLFADQVTDSIQALLNISAYRRERQTDYNTEHNITPQTVKRAVQESLHMFQRGRKLEESVVGEEKGGYAVTEILRELEAEMAEAASSLEYERAALLRDQIRELKRQAGISDASTQLPQRKVSYGKGKRRAKAGAS